MKYYLIIFATLLLLSCKNESEEKAEQIPEVVTTAITNDNAVIHLENPAAGDSQLPRLKSVQDKLYFSWVTRKDSIDQLYYSVLDGSDWELPDLIAQGKDWCRQRRGERFALHTSIAG